MQTTQKLRFSIIFDKIVSNVLKTIENDAVYCIKFEVISIFYAVCDETKRIVKRQGVGNAQTGNSDIEEGGNNGLKSVTSGLKAEGRPVAL